MRLSFLSLSWRDRRPLPSSGCLSSSPQTPPPETRCRPMGRRPRTLASFSLEALRIPAQKGVSMGGDPGCPGNDPYGTPLDNGQVTLHQTLNKGTSLSLNILGGTNREILNNKSACIIYSLLFNHTCSDPRHIFLKKNGFSNVNTLSFDLKDKDCITDS